MSFQNAAADSLRHVVTPMNFSEPFIGNVIIGFFVTLSLIVICFAIPGIMSYRGQAEHAREFGRTLERLQVLRIVMAIVMVFAATMLAVARIISAEAITAVISGITGYVLGGLDKALSISVGASQDADHKA